MPEMQNNESLIGLAGIATMDMQMVISQLATSSFEQGRKAGYLEAETQHELSEDGYEDGFAKGYDLGHSVGFKSGLAYEETP